MVTKNLVRVSGNTEIKFSNGLYWSRGRIYAPYHSVARLFDSGIDKSHQIPVTFPPSANSGNTLLPAVVVFADEANDIVVLELLLGPPKGVVELTRHQFYPVQQGEQGELYSYLTYNAAQDRVSLTFTFRQGGDSPNWEVEASDASHPFVVGHSGGVVVESDKARFSLAMFMSLKERSGGGGRGTTGYVTTIEKIHSILVNASNSAKISKHNEMKAKLIYDSVYDRKNSVGNKEAKRLRDKGFLPGAYQRGNGEARLIVVHKDLVAKIDRLLNAGQAEEQPVEVKVPVWQQQELLLVKRIIVQRQATEIVSVNLIG